MGGNLVQQIWRRLGEIERILANRPVRWAIQAPPSDGLIAKTTDVDDDPGQYTGRIRLPDGTYPDDDDCQIRNTEESASNGWGLQIGRELVCKDTGEATTDDPPRKILYVVGGPARTDSPIVLPQGTGMTLDGTTWNRDTSNGPVQFTPARGAYNSSTHKFYVISRPVTYDARGTLYEVGGEQAFEQVEATIGCGT